MTRKKRRRKVDGKRQEAGDKETEMETQMK